MAVITRATEETMDIVILFQEEILAISIIGQIIKAGETMEKTEGTGGIKACLHTF